MSTVFTVLASFLIYGTWNIDATPLPQSDDSDHAGGVIAGYAFELAPLIGSQAVIIEEYALQEFLLMLIITLNTRSVPTSATK